MLPHSLVTRCIRQGRRRLLLAASAVVFVALLVIVFHAKLWPEPRLSTRFTTQPNLPYFPPNARGCSAEDSPSWTLDPSEACANFPTHLLQGYQIVLKTGAAERDRTEKLLATLGACIPDILVVSDAPDYIHGYEVIDILASLPPSYATHAPVEWEEYGKQRAAAIAGEAIGKSTMGWMLDRFKFIPMVEEAYARATSHTRWFVFFEADVYMFWDTLFRLLEPLNAKDRHYIGAPVRGLRDIQFAYGGGGFVLSRGLLDALFVPGAERLSTKYEKMILDDCCGDAVLAYMLDAELGTKLRALHPIFTTETLEGLAVTRDRLCVPLLSLHRVSSEQASMLWRWERCQVSDHNPITHLSILNLTLSSDFNHHFTKDGWNNFADRQQPPQTLQQTSQIACAEACRLDASCLAYSYRPQMCLFSNAVMPGKPSTMPGLVSGWFLNKLRPNTESAVPGEGLAGQLCAETTWLSPKIFPDSWIP